MPYWIRPQVHLAQFPISQSDWMLRRRLLNFFTYCMPSNKAPSLLLPGGELSKAAKLQKPTLQIEVHADVV